MRKLTLRGVASPFRLYSLCHPQHRMLEKYGCFFSKVAQIAVWAFVASVFVSSCASDDANACRYPEPGRYIYESSARTWNAVLPFTDADCGVEGISFGEGFVSVVEFPRTEGVEGCNVAHTVIDDSSCTARVEAVCRFGTGAGESYFQEELWFNTTPRSADIFVEITVQDRSTGMDMCRGTVEASIVKP